MRRHRFSTWLAVLSALWHGRKIVVYGLHYQWKDADGNVVMERSGSDVLYALDR